MVHEGNKEVEELNGWHLDKRVPLSLIFAVFVQTVTVVWFITDLRKDVDALDAGLRYQTQIVAEEQVRQWSRIDLNQNRIQSSVSSINTNTAILQRVETQITRLLDILDK